MIDKQITLSTAEVNNVGSVYCHNMVECNRPTSPA